MLLSSRLGSFPSRKLPQLHDDALDKNENTTTQFSSIGLPHSFQFFSVFSSISSRTIGCAEIAWFGWNCPNSTQRRCLGLIICVHWDLGTCKTAGCHECGAGNCQPQLRLPGSLRRTRHGGDCESHTGPRATYRCCCQHARLRWMLLPTKWTNVLYYTCRDRDLRPLPTCVAKKLQEDIALRV